jgi:hypothetical protein
MRTIGIGTLVIAIVWFVVGFASCLTLMGLTGAVALVALLLR